MAIQCRGFGQCNSLFNLKEQLDYHIYYYHNFCPFDHEEIVTNGNGTSPHTEHLNTKMHKQCLVNDSREIPCNSLFRNKNSKDIHRKRCHQKSVTLVVTNSQGDKIRDIKINADEHGKWTCPCLKQEYSGIDTVKLYNHWRHCQMRMEQGSIPQRRQRSNSQSVAPLQRRQRMNDDDDTTGDESETDIVSNENYIILSNDEVLDRMNGMLSLWYVYLIFSMHGLNLYSYNREHGFLLCSSHGEGLIGRADESVANHFAKFHKNEVNLFERTGGSFTNAVRLFRNERTNEGHEGIINEFLQGSNQSMIEKPNPIKGIKIFKDGYFCQACRLNIRKYTITFAAMKQHYRKFHNELAITFDGNVSKGKMIL
jgi:hypothetical protein